MQRPTIADALLSATKPDEIVLHLTRYLWAKGHNGDLCPPDMIPTEADLCAWFDPDSPAWTLRRPSNTVAQWAPVYWRMEQDGDAWRPLDTPRVRLCLVEFGAGPEMFMPRPLHEVHGEWCALAAPRSLHPLAALVGAWQNRPTPVETDRRGRGILPGPLRTARQGRLLDEWPEHLNGLTPLGMLAEPAQAYLPGMEPPKGAIVPVLPVMVYDAAGGKLQTRGQGAPIAQRLFFEAMMTVNRLEREPFYTRQPDATLRDLMTWIWPNGWQRGRDLPRLQMALWELDNMRIHWDRALWRLVAVDRLPADDADLDDPVMLRIQHLPGSGQGPLIDRPRLRLFGLQSAPAWRSYLRLAYIWDAAKASNGGRRIYATRPAVKRGRDGVLLNADGKPILKRGGAPVKDWSDPRAVLLYDADGKPILERNPQADRVPVLSVDELARLGFDDNVTTTNRGKRAERTRDALTDMKRQKAVVPEQDSDGLRILEPAPSVGG